MNYSTTVYLAGVPVRSSRNLRGARDYARVSPVARADCEKRNAHDNDPAGILYITYANGATCAADFSSYRIMVDFVRTRRSWKGAAIRYLGGDVGYLTRPGLIAGP